MLDRFLQWNVLFTFGFFHALSTAFFPNVIFFCLLLSPSKYKERNALLILRIYSILKLLGGAECGIHIIWLIKDIYMRYRGL